VTDPASQQTADATDTQRSGWLQAPVELVLFDLDGTLTASGPGILASVRHALGQVGHPIPSPEQLDSFIGPPLLDSFTGVCGMDEPEAHRAIAAYREFYGHTGQYDNSVYPDIPEVLDTVRAAGITLAVATSKAEPYARSILKHFGLSTWFAAVVGSELDGRRTAKAEVIAEALRRLEHPAAGTVMIGDRSHDVHGATAVGIACIGALWGYGSPGELADAGAAVLVDSPASLPAALLR
jgi:phosphoglycolate phosphatase